MAKKQLIGKGVGPERLTPYKRAALCREWSRIEDERLDLQARMYERGKQLEEIERQLAEQLELDGVEMVDLPRFEFGHELVAGSMFYKRALIAEIGLEEFERRLRKLPKKRRFFLRDKGPGKARGTRREGRAA